FRVSRAAQETAKQRLPFRSAMVELAMHEGAGQHSPVFLARDQVSKAWWQVFSRSLAISQRDRHRGTIGDFAEQAAQHGMNGRKQRTAFMGGHRKNDCIRVECHASVAKDLMPAAA